MATANLEVTIQGTGTPGLPGAPGVVQSVVAGTGITVAGTAAVPTVTLNPATNAETLTGTLTTKAVTPAGLTAKLPYFDVRRYGALGTDTGNDAPAIQAAINAATAVGGGTVFFPVGTYRISTALTVSSPGVFLVGVSRTNTFINVNLNNTTDGITWFHTFDATYPEGGGIFDLTVRAVDDRVSVRDVLVVQDPYNFTLQRATFRGGARYGINLRYSIDCSIIDCTSEWNNTAALYINATTSISTTVRVLGGYFRRTQNGPGADILALGVQFVGTLFESNGQFTPANGHGVLVRGGDAFLYGCYYENNTAWDVKAGTESDTHLVLSGFTGRLGPESNTLYGHVYLGSWIRSANLTGGKYDVRKSVAVEPGAEQVCGMGLRWAAETPYMTDASNIMLNKNVHLQGNNPATGEQQVYGRGVAKIDPVTANTGLGYNAQNALTTGTRNVGVGHLAQSALTLGNYNTAVGYATQNAMTTADSNTAVGYATQNAMTSGTSNVGMGVNAQTALTTGSNNVGVGYQTQYSPGGVAANATTTALRQTCVGHETGQSSAVQSNDITTIGYRATGTGLGATSLGSGSTAAFAGSVALGMGTNTTAVDQVKIGARHFELLELAADPAAGATNAGRLYLKDNGAGKTQLAVRFPTGVVQILATEP